MVEVHYENNTEWSYRKQVVGLAGPLPSLDKKCGHAVLHQGCLLLPTCQLEHLRLPKG